MITIKAISQDGRLRLDEPIELTEGTEVEIEVRCADPDLHRRREDREWELANAPEREKRIQSYFE